MWRDAYCAPSPVPPPRRLAAGRKAQPRWTPQVDQSTAIVDCAVYRDGCRGTGEPTWEQAREDMLQHRSGFVWIGLHEPGERQLAGLAEHFGLHPRAVEDAVQAVSVVQNEDMRKISA